MKTVLLLHGYNGIPQVFYWLKEELGKIGINSIIPSLPMQENVRYNIWKEAFEKIKKGLEEELIVIAHSIGNSFIIKYMKENKLDIKVYVGLSGFSDVYITENREDLNEAIKDLVPSEEEIENFREKVKIKYCVYSDDDHIVPLEILKKHAENINGISYMIPGIGHMGKKSNLKELPQVMEIIKNNCNTD